jgi:hypothetical protein
VHGRPKRPSRQRPGVSRLAELGQPLPNVAAIGIAGTYIAIHDGLIVFDHCVREFGHSITSPNGHWAWRRGHIASVPRRDPPQRRLRFVSVGIASSRIIPDHASRHASGSASCANNGAGSIPVKTARKFLKISPPAVPHWRHATTVRMPLPMHCLRSGPQTTRSRAPCRASMQSARIPSDQRPGGPDHPRHDRA